MEILYGRASGISQWISHEISNCRWNDYTVAILPPAKTRIMAIRILPIFIALIIKSACYRSEWIERTTRFVDLVRGSEEILRSRDAGTRRREKEESGKSKGGRGRSLGTLHGGGFRARIPVSTATVMVIAPSRAIPLAPMQFTRSITPY